MSEEPASSPRNHGDEAGGHAVEPPGGDDDEATLEHARSVAEGAHAAARSAVVALLAANDARSLVVDHAQAEQARALAAAARAWPCTHTVTAAASGSGVAQAYAEEAGWEVAGRGNDPDDDYPELHTAVYGACGEAVQALVSEVAVRQHVSASRAHRMIATGLRLEALMSATLSAWEAGSLHQSQVDTIQSAIEQVDRDVAAPVLEALDARLCGPRRGELDQTHVLHGRQLNRRVRTLLLELDVEAATKASREATARRTVRCWDESDGQASLQLTGPAPDIAAMSAAIQSAAATEKTAAAARNRAGAQTQDPWAVPDVDGGTGGRHDARGIDAHRFDAAVRLITRRRPETDDTDAASREDAGQQIVPFPAGGRDVPPGAAAANHVSAPDSRVDLLVGLPTLLGANDAPGYLDGYGPLPAWMVRVLATRSPLRRFLVHPMTGALLHVDGHTFPALTHRDLSTAVSDPGGGGSGDQGPGRGGPPPPRRPPSPSPPSPVPPSPPSAPTQPAHAGRSADQCRPLDPEVCPVRASAAAPGVPASGRYVPSPTLARHLRRVWAHCSHPGCTRSASQCHLDHVIRWPEGTTCGCNVAPLCSFHHLLKHGTPLTSGPAGAFGARAGSLPWTWTLWRCQHGHQHWVSPLGVERVVAAPTPLPHLTELGVSREWARSPVPALVELLPLTYPLPRAGDTFGALPWPTPPAGGLGLPQPAAPVGFSQLPDDPPF